jgi:flagellar L-ring protein precursor FlgH
MAMSLTRIFRTALIGACALGAAGCADISRLTGDSLRTVEMHQPLTAAPLPPPALPRSNGAIFQSAAYQPLFEDRRARSIGDTITININEKLNASKNATTSTAHKGGTTFDVADLKLGTWGIKGGSVAANSDNSFAGSGDSGANNTFVGTITVTVVNVLPNGNLLVAGEKQFGINTGSEFIRLSGVINPIYIQAGNVVSSTQVADARLEYRGSGTIDQAQTQGWLSRAFNVIMPF